MQYDSFITHSVDMYMGKPKSGKTLITGSYPKPMLYISVGNDGGGRVLLMKYQQDIAKGLIKVKNLTNDPMVNGKINKTSCEKLAELLAELRKPGADEFKTIVIDTVGALQDDYKTYLEAQKGGKRLNMEQWGEIQTILISLKDNMKRFSQEKGVTFVWVCHTREQEVTETSGLAKELRIVPDLTISTGVKYMKDASNIFYVCRKTIIGPNKERTVKFLTYAGPHPLIDTGTRDIALAEGEFIEDFNYDKWQKFVEAGAIRGVNILEPEPIAEENKQED